MELIDFFDRGAELWPHRRCFVSSSTSLNYGDARQTSIHIAYSLRKWGISRGTPFAVLAEGSVSALVCALGGIRAHLVWLPVVVEEAPEKVAEELARLGCEVVFYDIAYEDIVEEWHARTSAPSFAVCINAGDNSLGITFDAWLDTSTSVFGEQPASPDDVAAIIPTGGTTGQAKGAVHGHLGFQLRVASHLALLPVKGPPRYLLGTPTSYMAVLQCFQMFVRGGTAFLSESNRPMQVAEAIERWKITDATLPVTLLYMILADSEARTKDFSSLQNLVYATAPMSEAKLRDAIAVFGPVLSQVYSQTETLAHITHFSTEDHFVDGVPANDERLRSCGRPAPMLRAAILGDGDEELGANQEGEIAVRGPSLMWGYYKHGERLERLPSGRWHRTGDAGFRDEEGFYYIVDRVADLISVGDELISPARLERLVLSVRGVRDCAVVGVGDTSKGDQRIVVVLELDDRSAELHEEIMRECEMKLRPLSRPVNLEVWHELPRSRRGKVLRRAVRERVVSGKDVGS